MRSFQEDWDYDTSVPLRVMFPKRMGVCRVLHVMECDVTTVEQPRDFRVNEEMHLEWIPEDVQYWTDCTSLPSYTDFVLHESVY